MKDRLSRKLLQLRCVIPHARIQRRLYTKVEAVHKTHKQQSAPLWMLGASALTLGGAAYYFGRGNVSTCSELERVRLGNVSDFQDGEMQEVRVHGGRDIVLVTRIKGQFYCTGYKCPHFGASFSDGGCTADYVICPYHNAKFDLKSGELLNGPCHEAIPSFKVEVDQGVLYAYLPPTPIADVAPIQQKRSIGQEDKVFVICGGGAAGCTAAETLRIEGFKGRILIYGDEKHLPYYRPHFTKRAETKNYDEVVAEQAMLPMSWYRNNQVEYYGGRKVTSINHENNTITLDDNSTVKYDKVLVATGSTAAKLPFTKGMDNLVNHFTLRTSDDFKKLMAQVKPSSKIVIVGANFIGCEMASSLKPTGANITVITDVSGTGKRHMISQLPGPMSRIVGPRGSAAITTLFNKDGIKLLPDQTIKGYTIKGDRITQVVTANQTIDADIVIEGVGASVNVEILKCAKKNPDGTVNVDETMRCQGCPDNVFAAGDIVTYPYHVDGSPISVKHWNVALQHGKVAAKNMAGIPAKMDVVPFFWSNFFRKGFRFAGFPRDVDDMVVEGDVEKHKFLVYYFSGPKAVAMLSMGMDDIGAAMGEAIDTGCVPPLSALKLGAANSQTMLQCLKKHRVSV